jgi:CBS domain-containing protein
VKLVELLARDRIVVPLQAKTLVDAATELAETLVASGIVTEVEEFRELVPGALPRDVVTVGQAFLLHYRTDTVGQLAAALGVSREPIRRSADSDKAADTVIILAAPPKESSAHLRALGTFARALSRQEVANAIRQATDADDILRAAPLADIEVPGFLTVRDVMVPRRLSVRLESTLGEASRLMAAHHVGALPVLSESGEVLGLVTYQELLRHLLPEYVKRESTGELRAETPRGKVADPHDVPVREVMDRSVLCVSEDQTVAEVAAMMLARNVERFPVVREGALVGFLTRSDIVRRLFGR